VYLLSELFNKDLNDLSKDKISIIDMRDIISLWYLVSYLFLHIAKRSRAISRCAKDLYIYR